MLDVSDTAAAVMTTRGYTMRVRAESWLDGDQLDGDVPVAGGTETSDVTLNVPEALTLTVPALYKGVSYVPGRVDDPLACWGQRLRVTLGVDLADGTEWLGRGWFYITGTSVADDTVTVAGSGLFGLLAEAQFLSPVTAAGTYESMIARLIEPALTADFTNAPDDVSIPAGTAWDAGVSRLDALGELLDAWPADAYVDQDGIVQVTAAGDSATAVAAYTDGAGGSSMRWGTGITRDGAASVVVAQGTTAAGNQVQGVAYDYDPASPTRYGGPFAALPVPFFFYSPLLASAASCSAAARTILARRRRQAARKITANAVPNLALQPRDAITVTAENLGIPATLGVVDQLSMPMTADSGPMVLGVRLP
jgi:hypothetical protein